MARIILAIFGLLILSSCKNETGHPLPPLTDSGVLNETDLLTGTPPHELLDRILKGLHMVCVHLALAQWIDSLLEV